MPLLSDLVSDMTGTLQHASEAGGSHEHEDQTCRSPLLYRRLGRPRLWGPTKLPCCGFGGKSAVRPSRKTSSNNLIVQLGVVTEDLNRRWYEVNSGQVDHGHSETGPAPEASAGWRRHSMAAFKSSGAVLKSKHAAMVVLGGGGRRKVHAAAATQYVDCGSEDSGAFDHHRRR